MEKSPFSIIIDRNNTNSLKYDFARHMGKPTGLLPMWVADMDFQAPPAVREALRKAVDHGIFGYADSGADYFMAVRGWYASRFGWELQPEWLLKTPGVVYALATAVRALTKPGDAIMVQQPVYPPFFNCIRGNGRVLINSPLVLEHGAYHMNYADMEEKICQNHVKMFLLCSPHNPVGRVWTQEELLHLGHMCMRHNVIVVADEIHADFVYPGHQHHVFAKLIPEYTSRTITCTAPSKTFNLAGLQISNIVITDPMLRRAFSTEMQQSGVHGVNALGLVACQAAYLYGGEWLEQLKRYLADNIAIVRGFLAEHLPQIQLIEPEGTYLLWLDFRHLGLTDTELDNFITNKAGLWLNSGTMFGQEGSGFQRVNVACPRALVRKALQQLAQAING